MLNAEDDDVAQSQLSSLDDILMTACGYNYIHNPEFISHWVPVHCCKEWNPVFCLFMAKKLFPDDRWEVFESKYHTSVLCLEKKQMFDILAWDYRPVMWPFLLGSDYISKYPDLGADLAMESLLRVD